MLSVLPPAPVAMPPIVPQATLMAAPYPLTALLGSVSTITTIGIYSPNIIVMPVLEKVLLIVGIIVSVGSAASLLQATFAAAMKRELLTQTLSTRKINRMKNHVIVVGYKFLGKYVIESLKSMASELVVIAVLSFSASRLSKMA